MPGRPPTEGTHHKGTMEVSFTIQVRLPDVEIKSIVFDECGNADVLLSAGGVEAKYQIDASGSDHGSF